MAIDDAAIAAAEVFTTVRFVGRTGREVGPVPREALYDRRVFSAADHGSRAAAWAAMAADRALGTDNGRGVVSYAVTPNGMTIHVEARHFDV